MIAGDAENWHIHIRQRFHRSIQNPLPLRAQGIGVEIRAVFSSQSPDHVPQKADEIRLRSQPVQDSVHPLQMLLVTAPGFGRADAAVAVCDELETIF